MLASSQISQSENSTNQMPGIDEDSNINDGNNITNGEENHDASPHQENGQFDDV